MGRSASRRRIVRGSLNTKVVNRPVNNDCSRGEKRRRRKYTDVRAHGWFMSYNTRGTTRYNTPTTHPQQSKHAVLPLFFSFPCLTCIHAIVVSAPLYMANPMM